MTPPENKTLKEAILRRHKRFGVPLKQKAQMAEVRNTSAHQNGNDNSPLRYRSMAKDMCEKSVRLDVKCGRRRFGKNTDGKSIVSKGVEKRNSNRLEMSKDGDKNFVEKEKLPTKNNQRNVAVKHGGRGKKFCGTRKFDRGVVKS